MNKELFVQNIKNICKLKDVYPTVACRESGVGTSFINNIERGQTPSVEKVQILAAYLGVTTSELLGEVSLSTTAINKEATPLSSGEATSKRIRELYGYKLQELFELILQLDPEDQAEIRGEIKVMLRNEKYNSRKKSHGA